MKTKLLRTLIGIAVTSTGLQFSALAGTEVLAKEAASSGAIAAVNPANRTMTLKQFLRSRTYNLPSNCAISIGNKHDVTLADLKPGMDVDVIYKKSDGVLIASQVTQEQKILTGSIKSLDGQAHKFALENKAITHDFKVADDCQFLVNDKATAWKDLKVGQRVTVHYVKENGAKFAERILNPHATLVGKLEAIDHVTDMVQARHLLQNKKFALAKDCKIVINGKADGQLRDLRIGQTVAIDYRDVNGVFIATRIAPSETVTEAAGANRTLGIDEMPEE